MAKLKNCIVSGPYVKHCLFTKNNSVCVYMSLYLLQLLNNVKPN